MKHQRLYFATLIAVGLTAVGCMQPGAPVLTSQTANQETVTAIALLSIADEGGRRLLATSGVVPWKKADIDHVNVALYQDGSTTPLVSRTVAQADLAGTITFTSLRMNTGYKVEVKAWADANESVRIDNLAADASSCTTSFSTTNESVVNAGVLKLQLVNKVFSGTTNGSTIQVTDGVVENPGASEAMTVATPTPAPTPTPVPIIIDPCLVDPTMPGCPGYIGIPGSI